MFRRCFQKVVHHCLGIKKTITPVKLLNFIMRYAFVVIFIYLFTFHAVLDIDFMSKKLADSRAFCIIRLSYVLKKFPELHTSLCDSQAETNFSSDNSGVL